MQALALCERGHAETFGIVEIEYSSCLKDMTYHAIKEALENTASHVESRCTTQELWK
jgi:hypothetical protein